MSDARLVVVAAGPLVSYQDAGRVGQMRFGVPASGPMDRLSHAGANAVLGNPVEATAIEVSLGGLTLECVDGAVTVAITGGEFAIEHDGSVGASWTVFSVRAGEGFSVRPGPSGSWAYVAFAGRIAAARWLAKTATHSLSGLGGGALRRGDVVDVSDARLDEERAGEVPRPDFVPVAQSARVVMGPQDHHFTQAATEALTAEPFRFSSAFDRMGVRLDGPELELLDVLSIPSEPIVRGSIQVAGDGVATLLFADHQTTGGYPKIATVISADLDALAQHRAGHEVRFGAVTPAQAVAAARKRAADALDYLALVASPGRTLAHRLMQQNLISGAVQPED